MISTAVVPQRRKAFFIRAQQALSKNSGHAAVTVAKQHTFTVAKTAAAAFAAVALTFSFPVFAEIDTDTYKAGAGAKIESSDLNNQTPSSIVDCQWN